ncbi:MAG: TetR/AcrR family transcriptional regulator [Nannocystaceae bacterium]|jgi:AcrR family transcriptional regulator
MARPKSDIDRRVVTAARARFLHDGVDGASLRSIAQDAGTNVGMIYYYFPSKDALFLAVVEEGYSRILADITAAMRAEQPVRERFHAIYRRLAALSELEFDIVRIVAREALVSSTRLQQLVARFGGGHVPVVLAAAQAGVADGTFDARHPLPALLAAVVASAVMPQILHRRLSTEVPALAGLLPPPPAFADAMFDIMMTGATPRTPVTAPPRAAGPAPSRGAASRSRGRGR